MIMRIMRYVKSWSWAVDISVYANDTSTAAAGGCSAFMSVIVSAKSANMRNMAAMYSQSHKLSNRWLCHILKNHIVIFSIQKIEDFPGYIKAMWFLLVFVQRLFALSIRKVWVKFPR